MSKKLIARLSATLLVALAGGALASTALAGGGTNCPDVWKPVICSDGHVYSNLCYAGLAHATGCVPYGDDT